MHRYLIFIGLTLLGVTPVVGAPATLVQVLNGSTVVTEANPFPVDCVTGCSGSGGGGTSSAYGDPFPSDGTAAGFLDSNGDMAPVELEVDGSLPVTVVGGGGSGGTASDFGSAFPTPGTAAGFNDGTNMQGGKIFDLDSGGGSDWIIGMSLRFAAGGGSVAAPGNATDGLLVNLGTNNDVTVTGAVSGTGTAGSAASGVMTVQGIASMTPLVVSDGTGSMNVIVDSGTLTSITNPVTVAQGTAGNLNATVVGTGTFATQAAQSGTWTVQPGNTANTTPWLASISEGGATAQVSADSGGALQVAVVAGGGTGGTSSNFASAFPSAGTAVGMDDGADMVPLTTTDGTSLDVNCVVGCAGGTFNNNSDNVATSATNGQAASWVYLWDGAAFDRAPGNATDGALVNLGSNNDVSATQSGTWNIGTVTTVTSVTNPVTVTDGAGALNVIVDSGSITANAGTNLNTSALALESGGNLATIAGAVAGSEMQVDVVSSALPSGASTSAKQPALGAAGTASTDVITVQGIAGMTPLLATVSDGSGALNVIVDSGTLTAVTSITDPVTIGAFPDNEPINVAQMNGTAVTMGNGASGTGVQRVTLANDSTGVLATVSNVATIGTSVTPGTAAANLGKAEDAVHGSGDTGVAVWAVQRNTPTTTAADGDYVPPITDANQRLWVSGTGLTAAAVPPNATYLAGAGDGGLAAGTAAVVGQIICTDSVAIDTASSGNVELVSLTSSETIYVCGYDFIASGAVSVQMIYGTGTACATGETNLTGAYSLAANGGIAKAMTYGNAMKAAVSNALCIELSGAVQVSGSIQYTKF